MRPTVVASAAATMRLYFGTTPSTSGFKVPRSPMAYGVTMSAAKDTTTSPAAFTVTGAVRPLLSSPSTTMVPTLLRMRSEEHTSELQSRLHLVCRLLLEKKKTHQHEIYTGSTTYVTYSHLIRHYL